MPIIRNQFYMTINTFVRTNYGTFNIRFQGAKVWNDISDGLKLLPLKTFKKNLKLILVEKY